MMSGDSAKQQPVKGNWAIYGGGVGGPECTWRVKMNVTEIEVRSLSTGVTHLKGLRGTEIKLITLMISEINK